MNKKQLIVAIIIFAGLLIISLFVLKKEDSTWEKGEFANKTPLIQDLDVNLVAKFMVYNMNQRLEISNKNGKWVVYNRNFYPADYEKIRNFIMTIRDLKIAQKLRLKKKSFGDLKLISPDDKESGLEKTGTKLVLYNEQGDILLSLLLGDYHLADVKNPSPFSPPIKDGRYVMVSGSEKPVLTSSPLTVASPDPKIWLDKKFINIKDLKSISKIDKQGKTEWRISRKKINSPYEVEGLKSNQRPNPQKMHQITSWTSRLKFLDVIPLKTNQSKTSLDEAETIVIKSFAGIKYVIKLAVKNNKAFANFAISLDMPKNRKISAKETAEEKIKLDKKFETDLNKALEKVKQEQFYTNWIYEFPLQDAKNILINQTDLYQENEAPTTIMGE